MSSHEHLLGDEVPIPLHAVAEINYRVEDRVTQVKFASGTTITIDQQYVEDFADLAHHLAAMVDPFIAVGHSGSYRHTCSACTPEEKL